MKIKETITEADLLDLGFITKPQIIHESRVVLADEIYIGQKDEDGKRKALFVLDLPRGFRFQKSIVVNYLGEILFIKSGMMSGGIDIYKELCDNSNFFFRETPEWKDSVLKFIDNIAEKEDAHNE